MRDDYSGPAHLIFGSVSHQGTANLHRTSTGWEGEFEFTFEVSVEEWNDLMLAASADFAGWPAALQIEDNPPQPATVKSNGEQIEVAGVGETPW